MSDLLKDRLNLEAVSSLGQRIQQVEPGFDSEAFVRTVENKFLCLELMQRAEHVASALRQYLPSDMEKALSILHESLGEPLTVHGYGETPFFYLPHSCFIKNYAVEHFNTAMKVQHALTQRFTAEFCLRPFVVKYPQRTLSVLHDWAEDPNEHVRRLVSEGTRPRLPWAPRIRQFQQNPQPVIDLLEKLKDDEVLYVRRSVANNLNDISKDNPDIALRVTADWAQSASNERRWIVRHGLRSLVKSGNQTALAILGYHPDPSVEIENVTMPSQGQRGTKIKIAFDIVSTATKPQPLLVDFVIYFIKANGSASAKVFKLKQMQLRPGERVRLQKSISFFAMTTRTLYPGTHRIDALINGEKRTLGQFLLK